jgi:glutamine synthetase
LTDTPAALEVWGRKEVSELFDSLNVLTPEELHARQEVEYEKYIMKRQIEARIVGDMATSIVLPTAMAYQNMLIDNITGLTDIFGKGSEAMTAGQREILATVSETVSALHSSASKLRQERGKINKIEDFAKRAVKYGSVVTPLIEEVGQHCAKLEQLVDNEIWPLPKFQEMLFTR